MMLMKMSLMMRREELKMSESIYEDEWIAALSPLPLRGQPDDEDVIDDEEEGVEDV